MNRRSAMLMAAGMVLTLMIGGAAISAGLIGPAASAATPRTARHLKAPKPIVKTIRKTVTVHKKSSPTASAAISFASSVAPQTIWPVQPTTYPSSASSSASSSSSGYHDDGSDGYVPGTGGGGDD